MGLNERGNVNMSGYEKSIESLSGTLESRFISSEAAEEGSESPRIIPCFNGKSLQIHEELVVNGLSAISIKHHKGKCKNEKRSSEEEKPVKQKPSRAENEDKENRSEPKKLVDLCYKDCPKIGSGVPDCLKEKMKRRNSFWNIHRPELSKLTWPENVMSSVVLQEFFHNHMRIHGTFCEPLHEFSNQFSVIDEEFQDYSKLREIVPPRVLPPDEKVVTIMEKSRSVQLNDEDLDPQAMVHKSRAEFCVTIGEYIRRPPIKRTTSQQMPKLHIHPTNRFESLPPQHEGLLSKEGMLSEEKVSAVVGNTDFLTHPSVRKKSSEKLVSRNVSGIALRRASVTDAQRLVVTSPPSLINIHDRRDDRGPETGNDAARLRTILSPRHDSAEEAGRLG